MLRHSTPDFFPRFTLLLGTSYYKKVHMRGREKSSIIWMHLSVHSASLKVIQQRWKNAHKHHMENKWGIRLNKILARNEKDWIHCYHAFCARVLIKLGQLGSIIRSVFDLAPICRQTIKNQTRDVIFHMSWNDLTHWIVCIEKHFCTCWQ